MDAPFVRPGRLLPPKNETWGPGSAPPTEKDGATIDNQWLGFRENFCVVSWNVTIFDMNWAFGMGLVHIVPPKSVGL